MFPSMTSQCSDFDFGWVGTLDFQIRDCIPPPYPHCVENNVLRNIPCNFEGQQGEMCGQAGKRKTPAGSHFSLKESDFFGKHQSLLLRSVTN